MDAAFGSVEHGEQLALCGGPAEVHVSGPRRNEDPPGAADDLDVAGEAYAVLRSDDLEVHRAGALHAVVGKGRECRRVMHHANVGDVVLVTGVDQRERHFGGPPG
jgi:hypothetical protein